MTRILWPAGNLEKDPSLRGLQDALRRNRGGEKNRLGMMLILSKDYVITLVVN